MKSGSVVPARREQESLEVEVRDYKAALRFVMTIFVQQSRQHHLHQKREHGNVQHRANYKDCPGEPCVSDKRDLGKLQALVEQYRVPGDPLGKLPEDGGE